MKRFLLLPLVSAFFLSSPISAQGGVTTELTHFDGQFALDLVGVSSAIVGDIDGDGLPDLITGAPGTDPGGFNQGGSAMVFSGVTGALIWRFDGSAKDALMGHFVASAGDVDLDGRDDVIVGAPGANPGGFLRAGSAYVFSGATGQELWRFDGQATGTNMGVCVASAGDVDGDGHGDLLVGGPFASPNGISPAGSVFVYSGATGALLYQFDGTSAGERFGFSVKSAGDLNSDGTPDFLIGATLTDPNGLIDVGSAFAYSGADGSLLYRWDGMSADDQFGGAVAGVGDVDGDGVDDVVIGAVGAEPNGEELNGSAYVYSGATGLLLWQFDGADHRGRFGLAVAGAGDIDRDGFADILISAPFAAPNDWMGAGTTYVFSGATGQILMRMDGEAPMDMQGWGVDGGSDIDGDGWDDVITSAIWAWPQGVFRAGRAYVYSFDPMLTVDADEVSSSSGGTVQFMNNFPASEAGQNFLLTGSMVGIGSLVLRGGEMPLVLDSFTMRMVFNPPLVFFNSIGILDANGDATTTLTLLPGDLATRIGSTFWFASVAYDLVGGVHVSSVARPLTITP